MSQIYNLRGVQPRHLFFHAVTGGVTNMLTQRTSKIQAEDTINRWTAAELGDKQARKNHKRMIRRRRRVLEKQESFKMINEYKKGG